MASAPSSDKPRIAAPSDFDGSWNLVKLETLFIDDPTSVAAWATYDPQAAAPLSLVIDGDRFLEKETSVGCERNLASKVTDRQGTLWTLRLETMSCTPMPCTGNPLDGIEVKTREKVQEAFINARSKSYISSAYACSVEIIQWHLSSERKADVRYVSLDDGALQVIDDFHRATFRRVTGGSQTE